MRPRVMLSVAFMTTAVAPVMFPHPLLVDPSSPSGPQERYPCTGDRGICRLSPLLPFHLVGIVAHGVITQDEANTLLQFPQLMTTPEDILLLLESLVINITLLLPNSTGGATATNTMTQAKRAWWTPPPIPTLPLIPSCWWSWGCKPDVNGEWIPPIPTPPSIPSCWWSQSCKRGVPEGQVTHSTVESLINQATQAGVISQTYGDMLGGPSPRDSSTLV